MERLDQLPLPKGVLEDNKHSVLIDEAEVGNPPSLSSEPDTDEGVYTVDKIKFTVPGEPLAGSQLRFNRKTGTPYRPKEHKQRVFTVYEYAEQKMEELHLSKPHFRQGTPLILYVEFYFPYRKADYRTGKRSGELKESAPKWCLAKKDLDNLLKPLKDGMKGIIYHDDSQVCQYGMISKKYSESPRTVVGIGTLT